jgi:hypothetical protein
MHPGKEKRLLVKKVQICFLDTAALLCFECFYLLPNSCRNPILIATVVKRKGIFEVIKP